MDIVCVGKVYGRVLIFVWWDWFCCRYFCNGICNRIVDLLGDGVVYFYNGVIFGFCFGCYIVCVRVFDNLSLGLGL